jgi:ABC-type nickel/cobalt efflux system permease component RcnA
MRPAFAALALLIACAAAAHAQPLPMPPPGDAPADPSWLDSLFAYIQQQQRELQRGLAKAVHAVKEEGSLGALAGLLGLAFLYGVFHAAGPGHGKAVIATYLMSNESALRRGVTLSFLSAAAQGVTAICAVGLLAVMLGFVSREVAGVMDVLEDVSYAMIAAIGVYLIVHTVRSILAGRDLHDAAHDHAHHDHGQGHAHDHGHHHAHDHVHVVPADIRSWREGVAVVAAIGLRPCSGAVLVLLFALAQGMFFVGALATAAISLGTAITVAALAVASTSARGLALKLAGGMDGWLLWTFWGLRLLGGLALLILGLALFLDPTKPPLPGVG